MRFNKANSNDKPLETACYLWASESRLVKLWWLRDDFTPWEVRWSRAVVNTLVCVAVCYISASNNQQTVVGVPSRVAWLCTASVFSNKVKENQLLHFKYLESLYLCWIKVCRISSVTTQFRMRRSILTAALQNKKCFKNWYRISQYKHITYSKMSEVITVKRFIHGYCLWFWKRFQSFK